jgi:hypothetical protein
MDVFVLAIGLILVIGGWLLYCNAKTCRVCLEILDYEYNYNDYSLKTKGLWALLPSYNSMSWGFVFFKRLEDMIPDCPEKTEYFNSKGK